MHFHTSVLAFIVTITTVLTSETTSFSAQWQARVQSDIDNINTDFDVLTASAENFKTKAIVKNINQLTSDVHTATQNVQAGPGVNDLAAMAIVFYVEEQMAPKVEQAMSALVKVKKKVSKAGNAKPWHEG